LRGHLRDQASPECGPQLRPCGRRAEQRDHRRRDRRAVVRFGELGNGDRTGGTSAGRDDIGSPHVCADSDADADTTSYTGTNSYTDTDTDAESDPGSKPQP